MTPPQPAKPDKPDKHLSLVIKTTAGDWTEKFNDSNKVRVLLERTIEHFRLDPNPPSRYKVVRESTGQTMALDQRLGDYELADGETILVQATRPTDG